MRNPWFFKDSEAAEQAQADATAEQILASFQPGGANNPRVSSTGAANQLRADPNWPLRSGSPSAPGQAWHDATGDPAQAGYSGEGPGGAR